MICLCGKVISLCDKTGCIHNCQNWYHESSFLLYSHCTKKIQTSYSLCCSVVYAYDDINDGRKYAVLTDPHNIIGPLKTINLAFCLLIWDEIQL